MCGLDPLQRYPVGPTAVVQLVGMRATLDDLEWALVWTLQRGFDFVHPDEDEIGTIE